MADDPDNPLAKFELEPVLVSWPRSSVTAWTPYHERGQTFDCFTKHEIKGMWDLYERALRQHGDREFLVHGERRLTFAQLLQLAERVAGFLVQQGCAPGDRVAFAGQNSVEWVAVLVASTAAGMVAVPMNSWWTGKEMVYGLNDSGAKVLFADAERLRRITPDKEQLKTCRTLVSLEEPDFARLVRGAPVHKLWNRATPPVAVDEAAVLMYTSGTTANPKGVVLTHRGVAHAIIVNDLANLMLGMMNPAAAAAPKSVLLTVPLFHVTGLHVVLLASFVMARKVVIMSKWNPEHALELVERERITTFTGVPTMVQQMLASPDLAKRDVSSLQAISAGGAPVPAGVAKKTSETFKTAAPGQGYGLTEINGVATVLSGPDYLARPTSYGSPIPGVQVAVWAEGKDEPVPAGTPGRIMIRGVTLMREYWGQPQATAKAITKDGWFDSGDIGHLAEDGFLYISDRAKDIIIRGGENISCRAVEEAVYAAFPEISEVAAFGAPHEILGEHVALAVTMRAGAKAPSLEALRTKLTKTLAAYELPTALAVFPDLLPRGATGKTVKRDIRDMVKAGKFPPGVVWVDSSTAAAAGDKRPRAKM